MRVGATSLVRNAFRLINAPEKSLASKDKIKTLSTKLDRAALACLKNITRSLYALTRIICTFMETLIQARPDLCKFNSSGVQGIATVKRLAK